MISQKTRWNGKNTGELKFQDYNFENPPQFRKDGDLRFYDSNTQEELFHIETEVKH